MQYDDRMDDDERREAQLLRRHQTKDRERAAVEVSPITGREFYYVPGELLLHRGSVDASLAEVTEELTRLAGGTPRIEDTAGGALRLLVDPSLPVPGLVASLRQRFRVSVSPNHVFFGLPSHSGKPAGAPSEATMRDIPPADAAGKRTGHPPVVTILDTGIDVDHASWRDAIFPDLGIAALGDYTRKGVIAGVAPDPADVNPADRALDWEAGHGTFIAGIVGQIAPDASIEVRRVLDSDGVGIESQIAAAIIDSRDSDIINLSLGGYTQDDLPPLAFIEAFEHLVDQTVVVAAAGNEGNGCRPLWPAAMKRVLAVGGLGTDDRPARFTNHGFWVDACAPAVNILSTFLAFSGPLEADRSVGARTFDYAARWSGTSFAAPQLTGAIARAAERGKAMDAARALLAGRPRVPGLGVTFEPVLGSS